MRLHWDRPASRWGTLPAFGLLGAIALLVARFIPVAVWFRGFWGCALRRITGIPCPACGLTRAFDYTAHGRFLDAFRTTPLGALVPWLCLILALYSIAIVVARAPIPRLELMPRAGNWMRFGFVALVALNWMYMVLMRPGQS
jgi:hypothetical protein